MRSLLEQTLGDWEAVVAADDDRHYGAILARQGIADPRIRHVRTDRPRTGAAGARNVAWAAAHGGVAAPLDADDAWFPRRLEVLLPIAETRGAAADNVRVVDDATGRPVGTLFPAGEGDRLLDAPPSSRRPCRS